MPKHLFFFFFEITTSNDTTRRGHANLLTNGNDLDLFMRVNKSIPWLDNGWNKAISLRNPNVEISETIVKFLQHIYRYDHAITFVHPGCSRFETKDIHSTIARKIPEVVAFIHRTY